jgi:hypothetical protein
MLTDGRCIYCGGGPLHREHILAEWIAELLGVSGEMSLHMMDGANRRFPTAKTFNIVTTQVCQDCNTGWMNDMEGAARPYLGPMMLGRAGVLNAAAQMAVAAWFWKLMLTMEWATTMRFFTSEERTTLRTTQRPPAPTLFKAFVAPYGGAHRKHINSAMWAAELLAATGRVGEYCCLTVSLGGLLLQGIYLRIPTNDARQFELSVKPVPGVELLPVWPTRMLVFPHSVPSVSEDQFRLVAERAASQPLQWPAGH